MAVIAAMLAMATTIVAVGTGQAQEANDYASFPQVDQVLDHTLLAKAQPDECFNGVGQPITYPNEDGECEPGTPKVNESYVWGLAKSGSSLWFGTAANVLCGVLFGYLEVAEPVGGQPGDDYVCERSVAATTDPPMPARTDSRVPSIWEYDLAAGELIHHAGPEDGVVTGNIDGWTTDATTLLSRTGGFRSAGSLGDTVILAGAGRSLTGQSGINVFAFNAETDTLIGHTTLVGYSNIRKWFTHEGVLYTGVGVSAAAGGGGQVLRWNGPGNPLGFTQVGTTGSEIAELAVHEGRLFGASWPQHGAVEVPAGLYMSPPIPAGGLPQSTTAWEMVWQATDYEPDPVTASTYGTGALASFDGYLYWGTMHVPGRAAIAHEDAYGEPANQDEASETFINTLRAISIFRGRDFGTASPETEVVYGESELTVWDPGTSQWVTEPTGMGEPIWGPSGFGNTFNNYTWTMDVYDGSLYIGTMDWSYLAFGQLELSQEVIDYLADQGRSFGADLLRIDSSSGPRRFESVNGVGNYTNYGIRTMVSDADGLYLGSANPMNLMTDRTDAKPEGGWELLKLTTRPFASDFNGDGNADVLARDSYGRLWLYRGNGIGGWLASKQVGTGWNVMNRILAPADFDGDGHSDVLARDSSGRLWLYPGNGNSGFLAARQVGSGWGGFTAIVDPGDFDGDRHVDLLARDSSGRLWLYPGNGRGGWLAARQVGTGWNVMTALVGSGDFSGDGNVDLLARDSTGRLWLYPGNGRGGWLAAKAYGTGWNAMTALLGPGDFSGDGNVDLLARDSYGKLWLYPGNGNGGWLSRNQVGTGWGPFTAIVS